MASIFISYRRDDSIDITGRIFDRVISRFGKGVVFKDVDSLIGGQNFPEVLRQSIHRDTVMLVIIGRSWLGITQERTNDPNDYARIEIETALQRRATIIPVLIQGAQMPSRDQLPLSIADLANRHATIVRPDPDFTPDMNGVVRAIAPHMRSVGQRLTRLSIPLGMLLTLAVVAALVVPRFTSIPFFPPTCTHPLQSTTPKQINYPPPKIDGINGQALHIVGSGNAEQSLTDLQPSFDAVNGTCTLIERGGGGWLIDKTNEIGVTDFSTAYDLRSRKYGDGLTDHYLAILPEVVIVGDGVYKRGIHNLSRKTLVNIFHGDYHDWSQVDGGPSARIDVLRRTDTGDSINISGISLTFTKTVMQGVPISKTIASADNSLAALQNVANDPYAIRYIALQALNFYQSYQNVDHAISIGGYMPTLANVENGSYEFWDFVHAYTLKSLDENSTAGKAIHAMLQTVIARDFQTADFASISFLPLEIDRIRGDDLSCRKTTDICIWTIG